MAAQRQAAARRPFRLDRSSGEHWRLGVRPRTTTRKAARHLRTDPLMPIQVLDDGSVIDQKGRLFACRPQVIDKKKARHYAKTCRVILHIFPDATDITDDPKRVEKLVSQVSTDSSRFVYNASLCAFEREKILVLHYSH
jgi:hypothetical protein